MFLPYILSRIVVLCVLCVNHSFSFMLAPGWTALFLAAHKNNFEVAQVLCNSQANVDLRCEDGKTAISVAVQTGR